MSTAAVAKDLKQEKKATAPAVAATQMTDSEMDKVTAGAGGAVPTGGPDSLVTLTFQASVNAVGAGPVIGANRVIPTCLAAC